MELSFRRFSESSLVELSDILTRGFSDYFVPIQFSEAMLFQMVRLHSVELESCGLVCVDGQAAGAALIARRGWNCRLAAMSIAPDFRRMGLGSFLLKELIQEAKKRGDRRMLLEVIEQNEPAVQLYYGMGFQKKRRLVGYSLVDEGTEVAVSALADVDLHELARKVVDGAIEELPWQASGETLAQMTPPLRAFEHNSAYLACSDPGKEAVVIRSLLTLASERGKGRARALFEMLRAVYPGRKWKVPAICPEEIGGFFEKMGFAEESISQLQMSKSLV